MYALLDKKLGYLTLGYLTEDSKVKTFETGQEAKAFAKSLNNILGTKYQPRAYHPEQANDDWKQRERLKFFSGEYQEVLPSIAKHCKEEHFVHVSKGKPEELAYTKDAFDGARDVQKRISVRGYLEVHAPSVSAEEREALALEHLDWMLASVVKFARTPDEIEKVYTNYDEGSSEVASSCMRYKAESFASKEHPVRIYGAGDLAIAYLANEDGQTTARALCWPAKHIYSRVYGTEWLHDLLKKLGYKKSCSYYGDGSGASFEGAKVLRIEHHGDYVTPYIDGTVGLSFGSDDRYLVMSESPDLENGEGGLTGSDEDYYRCERCSELMNEDDGYRVHVSRWGAEVWCDNCEENHSFRCTGDDERYSSSQYDVR